MKLKWLIATIFFLTGLSSSDPIRAQGPTLEITNLDRQRGELFIAWYDRPEGFRDPLKAVYSKRVAISDLNSIEVVFDSVSVGTYAVAVFLDRNGNRKMDTNMMGIPKEKYGFSNNPNPLMRAANFDEASFTITKTPGKINIKLK